MRGRKIKLAFARLFVSRVNLLILDEPTNYLDIPSIEVLEIADGKIMPVVREKI